MSEGLYFEQPVMLKIDEIINESDDTKTFMFRHNLNYNIGQFIMVWLPDTDEKPFAVSYHSNDSFGISVLARGKFTRRLHVMRVGEQLGIRGPFGNGFSISSSIKNADRNVCIIGGGCGMASLAVLIERLQPNHNQKGDTNKSGQKHLYSPPSRPAKPFASPTGSFWRGRAQENIKDYSTTPSSPPYKGGEQGWL